MTPYHARTVALCLALIGTPALAQNSQPPMPASPPQAPAGGTPEKVPFSPPYGVPIANEQARTILAAAEAEAKKRGWPMSIAVVDTHGDLVHFTRMDGAMLASVQVAQNKARTSAHWRRETRVFFNAYASGANYVGTLDPDLVAAPGGVPLISDGKLIGAVGCSGGTGDQDAMVCQSAADALK